MTDTGRFASPAALIASAQVTATAIGDVDGDGIADSIEVLAGTNPSLATDAPSNGGTLTASKIQASFNFASSGKDTLKATLTFTPPSGFDPTGATVIVALGGYTSSLT